MVFMPRPAASLRVLCLPYAGAHATIFRAWFAQLPQSVEVCSIHLPARGSRMREDPITDFTTLIAECAPAVYPLLDRPFVIFGHSLGAVMGFEISRWLQRVERAPPLHLYVSGRRAPHLPATTPPIHGRSDPELLAYVASLNGTPQAILECPELVHLMLPALRADITLAETYAYQEGPPLDCSITAFGGLDDEESRSDALDGWRLHTTQTFASHLFPGDHFFIHSHEADVLRLLRRDLSGHLAIDATAGFRRFS